MDSKSALDNIKQAEDKAQEIAKESQMESAGIIQRAAQEKERILKAAKEKAKIYAEKLKPQAQKEQQGEISLIESRAEEEIKALKDTAKANFERALGFLKSKLN